jgi:hypothetical protein
MKAEDGRMRDEGRKNGSISSFLLPPSSLRLLIVAVLSFAAAGAHAADPPQAVWLISTRGAAHCGELDDSLNSVCYWRWTDECEWSSSDARGFQAADDATAPTVVFIHGNRTSDDDAVAKGWYVYETIRSQSAGRPFRYVIWSWPADRVGRRNRPDVQLKAAYSDAESYYLAAWMGTLRPGRKVSLVGHSFGPRIITGAMHMLAGGELAGQRLPKDTVAAWTAEKRNPVRAVLLAAAEDADALAPDSTNGLALSLLDQVLITRNCCDRVLRWYPRLYGRGGPQALGWSGPCGVDSDASAKIGVVDVSATVGKIHDWHRYCSASDVRSLWAHYTFLDDAPEPSERYSSNSRK